jgi:hypothetical protein
MHIAHRNLNVFQLGGVKTADPNKRNRRVRMIGKKSLRTNLRLVRILPIASSAAAPSLFKSNLTSAGREVDD